MGAQPYEKFKEIVDDEIRRANQLVEGGVARNQVYAALTRNGRTSAAPPPTKNNQQQQARRQPDPAAVYRVPVGNEPSKGGGANALVTIVQISDYECPFCKRVEPTVDQIIEEYGNDVRDHLVRQNPLPFHQQRWPRGARSPSRPTPSRAATPSSGKPMHAKLFENQRALGRERTSSATPSELGLNMSTSFKRGARQRRPTRTASPRTSRSPAASARAARRPSSSTAATCAAPSPSRALQAR